MNYLNLRRSNSISSVNDTGVNPALRSIYSSANSGQRALVFTVEVPERGPLGLDLRAKNVTNPNAQSGAIVKGFRPVKDGKRGYIELTGRVKEKDILTQMHKSRVDDMLFDAIVELAASLQSDLTAWPLRLEFRREAEEVEVKPKQQTFTSFLRSTSMSIAGFATTPAAPSAAPVTAAEKVQDGTFQDKLSYFRGFFKDRLPTSTETKKTKMNIPDLPSEELVNDMYRELLMKRNVPDDVLDELIRIEQLEQKWQIVWSAKQNENDENQVYIADAIKLAEALVELNWDNRGLQVLETLHRKISAATPEWTDQFIVSYGLDYLAMKMPEPSPFSIEHYYKTFDKASRFCEVILRILLSLSHFSSGIDAITHTLGLVDKLALCFHTDNSDVKKITLQVLGIICYNSADGHAAAVHSFSHYMEAKGERVRFTCLRDALKSTRYSLLFKEDVLSFINILVNKGLRVEARVAIRQDFMMLGIGEYFEEIRNKSHAMYTHAAKIKKRQASVQKPAKKTATPAHTPQKPSSVPPPLLVRTTSTPEKQESKPPTSPVLRPTSVSLPVDTELLITLPDIPVAPPQGLFQPDPFAPSILPGDNIKNPIAFPPSREIQHLPVIESDGEVEISDDTDDYESDEYDYDHSPLQLQIREQYDNVEKQIEVFELFMEDDRKDVLYGSTDLSSMESVIQSLMDRVRLDEYLRDCLHSILQQLLFIPSETVLGKEMWAMAERVTKEIALLSPVEEVRQYELSFQDRKTLLEARDKFTRFLSQNEPDILTNPIGGPIALMGNRNPRDELSDTDLDSTSEEDVPSEEDEIMQRLITFRKLKALGMPMEQVHVKMRMENLDPEWLEKYLPQQKKKKSIQNVMVKEHEEYRKYCKLISMGMPLAQVQMKMAAENPALDTTLLETPEKFIPLQDVPAEPLVVEKVPVIPPGLRADECSVLLKFFKLKKMGMPLPQIELKMQAEGFDSELLSAPDTIVDDEGKKVVDSMATPMGGCRADECPALLKFFKLKKMGMPLAQIELKMQAEGFESELIQAPDTIVDIEGKRIVLTIQEPAGTRADECPALAKFFKLQKMGMPPQQIQMKMSSEGFDDSLLLAPETLVDGEGKKVSAVATGIRADACEALAKFFKLKKMGMPMEQIQIKMQAEGFDSSVLDAPDTLVGEDGKKFQAEPLGVRADECEALKKFFKLKKMGMPNEQIQLKMKSEGFDPELLVSPETIVNEEGKKPEASVKMLKAKEHPSYIKFFKLMTMGMPLEQIKLKASSEGLDPNVLENPESMIPEDLSKPKEDTKPKKPVMIKVSDHPSYAKFFKLKKMGMPLPQIQLKMKAEGLDSDLLETPEKEIPEKADEPPQVMVKDHPQYKKYLKLQDMGMPSTQIEMKMKGENLDYALLSTPDAIVKEPNAKPADGNASSGPSMGTALTAIKFVNKIKAKPKLRALYWEPVQAEQQATTLWADIDTGKVAEEPHIEQLVSLFASAPPTKDKPTTKKPAMKKKAATRIGLIDVKRANNIGIMLARFRLPYSEIKRAILEVDRDVLSSEKVAALIQFAPEGEEMATVKGYTGDVKMLGDAEQYFMEIASIPRFQTRMQSIHATMQFDSNVEEQRRLITSVTSTCKELKSNQAIPIILKLVLQLGNTLNEGTARGSASGFRLSILLKLVQVKAADNSMTLLNYLAIILRQKEPEWLNFIESLPSIQESSRVTHQVLKAGEAAIRKAADLVVDELATHKKLTVVMENDKFQDSVGPFATKAQEISQAVHTEFESMLIEFSDCVKWFGEDPDAAGMGPDSFFSIFVSFAQMLQAADRDNERKRIAEERRLRREAETKKRMEMLAKSKQTSTDFNSLKAGDAHTIVKKIRGKRTEEKRKELVEQGFETTTNDSFCSTTSFEKKKSKPESNTEQNSIEIS